MEKESWGLVWALALVGSITVGTAIFMVYSPNSLGWLTVAVSSMVIGTIAGMAHKNMPLEDRYRSLLTCFGWWWLKIMAVVIALISGIIAVFLTNPSHFIRHEEEMVFAAGILALLIIVVPELYLFGPANKS
jgi:hypothetical protein